MKKLIPVCVFLLGLAAITRAQTPDPYSPARGSILPGNSVVLRWNTSGLPYSFDLEVADNAAFAGSQLFAGLSQDSLVYTIPQPATYFWRVRSSGQSNNSPVYTFTHFSPTLAGGLRGWFSALNITQANNTALQNWNSLEYTALASNANAATSPTYRSSGGLGNKPFVHFNGSVRQLTTNIKGSAIANTDPMEVYFLGKLNTQPQAYGFIFTMANFTTFTPNQHNRAAYNYNGGANFLWASNGGGVAAEYFISSPGNTYRMFTALDNTTTARLYRNGTLVGSGTAQTYSINPNAPLILGSNASYSNSSVLATSQMEVAEMIFFNQQHNDSLRNLTEDFLTQRYLPPVNLGRDTSVNPLCGLITLNAGTGYASYLWSTGASTAALPVTSPGIYWVQVSDGFGNTYSDTVRVASLSAFNQLPPVNYLCQGGSRVWQTNLPGASYNFVWSDNSTDTALTISSPGLYYVTVTQTTTGCVFTSDTVQVLNDPFPLAGLGNDTTLCLNNSLQLNVPGGPGSNYLWNTGEQSASIILSNPGTYWVHATNENGCYADDTVNVLLNGTAPVISFDAVQRCENAGTSFTASSNQNVLTYHWDFGDGNTSSLAQPQNTYLAAGTYPVELFILADNGCGNTLRRNITINAQPALSFSYADTCNNDSTVFTGHALPNAGGISSYAWNFNDPASGAANSSSVSAPKHTYVLPGQYFVSFTVQNDSGCVRTLTRPVLIKEGAYPDFTFSGVCYEGPTVFQNTTTFGNGVSPQSYTWFFGNGSTSNLFSPQFIFGAEDSFQVTLRVSTNNQCRAYKTKIVPVTKAALADFSMPDSICAGTPIPFLNNSTGINDNISSYLWRFSTAGTSQAAQPVFAYTGSGSRIVRLIVTTQAGCKDSLQGTIYVKQAPTASFTVNTTFGAPPLSVTPVFTGTNAGSYLWNFGNGVQSNLQEPGAVVYADTGVYTLVLIAGNNQNCSDSASVEIVVNERELSAEWMNVQCAESNGKISFSGTLLNTGNQLITDLELGARADYGAGFRELWNGSLGPGALLNYSFSGLIPVGTNALHFCCVDLYTINDSILIDPETRCRNLNDDFWVGMVYPNPAEQQIFADYILSEDDAMNWRVLDISGRVVLTGSVAANAGLNQLRIDILSLRKGTYVLEMRSRQGLQKQKFVRQ
ncbi:MAG: PKD domain-containing protein [Flavobacteriales bacterium]